MDVSVVVPLYDKAPWVQRALASISRQTWGRFEVVVVDDGSTDGSDRLARAHAVNDRRFRVVRQQNAGPGAARNAGVAQARGDVLAFLDADDEWSPYFLEDAVRALQAWPTVSSVTLGHRVVPGDAKRQRLWKRRRLPFGIFRTTPDVEVMRLVHVLAYMSPCATVIRREAFERHGGFYAERRCTYGEDAWLFLRLLLSGPVGLLPEPRVTFHLDASGLSANHARARPVEPFLEEPGPLSLATPRELLPLLRRFLSIRASKTALMLAFWGRADEARSLLERYAAERHPLQPWALPAQLAASRWGQWFGALARAVPALRHRVARRYAKALPPSLPLHVPEFPPVLSPVVAPDPALKETLLLEPAEPHPAEGVLELEGELGPEWLEPLPEGDEPLPWIAVAEGQPSAAELLSGLPPPEPETTARPTDPLAATDPAISREGLQRPQTKA